MDKEKINAILKQCEALTAIERAFLAKNLIKWGASDMRIQANTIKDLTYQLDSAGNCINRMRIDLAALKAKTARDILKNAEQKLKKSGGLGVIENEIHEQDRDNEGFNVLKEFGRVAAQNIDKAIVSGIENETEDDDRNGYQDGFNK